MKAINWSPEKNQSLINERGVSFEDVVFYLQQGGLLDDVEHPNDDKYPNQRVFVLNIDGYVYLVPYVEDRKEIFLKTIIPSRKATKQYLGVE
jgi:uncharacterized DUF497 family protein